MSLFGMDCNHQSHAKLLVQVILFPSLIDHRSFHGFIVSTESFLSVRNPLLLEQLHVASSKLEHDDPLDIGEVKLPNTVLKILTVIVHLRGYNNFIYTLL